MSTCFFSLSNEWQLMKFTTKTVHLTASLGIHSPLAKMIWLTWSSFVALFKLE